MVRAELGAVRAGKNGGEVAVLITMEREQFAARADLEADHEKAGTAQVESWEV